MTHPNPAQLQALEQFARGHGRYWKAALRSCWESTRYPAGTQRTDLLQQVRNQLGPTWLHSFRLVKP